MSLDPADPQARHRALQLRRIIPAGNAKMAAAATPLPPQVAYRSLVHPAMEAWRARHQVTVEEHRRRLIATGPLELERAADFAAGFEVRSAGLATVTALAPTTSTATGTLRGYVAVTGEWAVIDSPREGYFREQLVAGSLRRMMSEDKLTVVLEHGADPQLGRRPIATPTMQHEDERGAYIEAQVFDGLPAVVAAGLRAGAYGASVRMKVRSDDWAMKPQRSSDNPDGAPLPTIRDARVTEAGPVLWGAYASPKLVLS